MGAVFQPRLQRNIFNIYDHFGCVKGGQFAIPVIWTEKCLIDAEKQFLYKINSLKDII